ncbi:hypothetical protein OG897_36665 [Streptomyces sp. NBC_00237]|uniref:hypothetical protein n=1 Tax=Streptomyces sp. NBC_00237 TaxID=2975687 RepID=UPI0022511A89|nr:hypothetical protein [Streptomyces sp. NBC_00237]MCX5206922.1 hypothetical protein [Streptomyces sp. NBC_00237]
MPHNSRPTSARTSNPAAPLPTTIWLPTPETFTSAPAAPNVLPDWAIEKIRTDFRRPGDKSATLLRLHIQDTACGMDARTRCTTDNDDPAHERPHLLLAELHPDTLPTPWDTGASNTTTPGAIDDGWPGFFYRAHRLLPADGVLLLATRQRRDNGHLTDPLGLLIATARTAGFTYLQHLIAIHGHATDDHIHPTPPPGAPDGLIHSDLLVLRTSGQGS